MGTMGVVLSAKRTSLTALFTAKSLRGSGDMAIFERMHEPMQLTPDADADHPTPELRIPRVRP
jgi:hypothetical protein